MVSFLVLLLLLFGCVFAVLVLDVMLSCFSPLFFVVVLEGWFSGSFGRFLFLSLFCCWWWIELGDLFG